MCIQETVITYYPRLRFKYITNDASLCSNYQCKWWCLESLQQWCAVVMGTPCTIGETVYYGEHQLNKYIRKKRHRDRSTDGNSDNLVGWNKLTCQLYVKQKSVRIVNEKNIAKVEVIHNLLLVLYVLCEGAFA